MCSRKRGARYSHAKLYFTEKSGFSGARQDCTSRTIYENQATPHIDPDTKRREPMVGFDARNLQNIHEQYHCRICSLLLREPLQLNCGHRHCRSCIALKIQGEIIKCLQCNEQSNQKEMFLDRGVIQEMNLLMIECLLCSWKDFFRNYEDHLKSHPNPSCQYCGKEFQSTNQLNLHKLNDCEKITVSCALKNYGCSDLILRVEMAKHYLSKQHQCAIIAFIIRDLPKVIIDQPEGGVEMDIDNLPHTTTSLSGDSNAQLKEVDETVDVLAGGVQALSEDAQRLEGESAHYKNILEKITNDFGKLKPSIQEQNAFLDGLKPSQEILSQDVVSLKQKLEDLQSVSYDGTLIWRITNFAEKMADAQSEQQTSIYSPPFYSSPTGYKMRARLYLHGDGNARRTHMSVFFVLMRSEYDAILKFPFNHKVTFCLYDQSGGQKHIIDSFRPDIKSNSFQRPRSEMNIASGIPKYCPLSTIQQEGNGYVRDNTMFIKIMVDFGDMGKPLLVYAMNLNPALPTNIQQALIKQETDKRTQQTST